MDRPRIAGVALLLGRRLDTPPVLDDMRFAFPILAWDAWLILQHLGGEALVRNKDGSVPSRWFKPLEGRLPPMPSWTGIAAPPEGRLELALTLLQDFELLSVRKSGPRHAPNLAIAPAGEACLRSGRKEFFRSLLDWRELRPLDPANDETGTRGASRAHRLQWTVALVGPDGKGLGAQLARRVWEVLPRFGSARIRDIDAAFAPTDPFVPDRNMPWSERRVEVSLDDYFERIPREESTRFLADLILFATLLGLVSVGVNVEGHPTWSLSAAGRSWAGLGEDPLPEPSRHARLTPAFDLFFGRVDPQALAEIGLFSERTGQDHGVVARLTRTSVQSALSIGLAMEEIVECLEGLVQGGLPNNVRTTLDDWARGAQPVRVRDGILLECSDAEAAGSIERLAKGAAERVGETRLFVTDRRTLNALRRKAREAGIFL